MNFTGIIVEESLNDTSILNDVKILSTEIEPVTEGHKTPWLKQWTMHTVEVSEDKARDVAERISMSIKQEHQSSWYADFKTDHEHFIIYPNKVFHVTDRSDKVQYDAATKYGISIGIPAYQVDFDPDVQQWER